MPVYEITDPTTGKTLELEGDSPPTEQELNDIFGTVHGAAPPAPAPKPPAAPSLTDRFLDTAKQTAAPALAVGQMAIGAAKGLGQSVLGAGRMIQAIPGVTSAVDALYGTPGISKAAFGVGDEMMQPANGWQTAGKVGEQIGEALAVGAPLERAGVALAGKVGRFALPARMAVEGVGQGTLAKVQGGDPAVGAVLGAAAPVAGEALRAAAPWLKESAGKRVVQALGPTKEKFKAIAERIAPEVLKRGLGGSREALQEQAGQAAQAAGEQIDEAIQTYGDRVLDTTPILKALDDAKAKFINVVRVPTKAADEAAPSVEQAASTLVKSSKPAEFTGANESQIFMNVLKDARQQGYTGTDRELRGLFDDAVRDAKDLQSEMAATDVDPKALLKAIAEYGGISLKKEARQGAGAMGGETRWYLEGKEGARQQTGTWGGVRGVFRAGAGERLPNAAQRQYAEQVLGKTVKSAPKTWDEMREAIATDPRFSHLDIPSINEFEQLVRDAAHGAGPGMGLGTALERLNLRPGEKWWDATAFDPAALEAAPAAGTEAAASHIDKPVVLDPRVVRQITKLQTTIAEHGPEMRVDQLVALRRVWDKVVAQAGGFAHRAPGGIGLPLKEQTEAWAKREATGAIRKLLDEQVPELSALNKEYSFWKNLDDVLTQTMKRSAPQGPGLRSMAAEGAGRLAGALGAKGGAVSTVGHAFVLGKMLKLAERAFTSPRWRLVEARTKDALAEAIASGQTDRAAQILSRIAASQGAQAAAMVTSSP